jgi:hypothetical protein
MRKAARKSDITICHLLILHHLVEGPVKVQLNWINGKALNWHYRGETVGGHFKRKT